MTIITINTAETATAVDIAILRAYLDTVLPEAKAIPTALVVKNAEIEGTVKPRTRKKATAPDPVEVHAVGPEADDGAPSPQEADPEPESTGPTLDDAVKKATELVSSGKKDEVKAALAKAGAGRVSELSGDQIATFLGEL